VKRAPRRRRRSRRLRVQTVDATIVPVPKQRNSGDENEAVKAGRIPEAWDNKSFFGYKNHVNADAKHKLIRRYEVTDAAVHDSQKLEGLLTRGNTSAEVFADSAYRSTKIEAQLRASGFKSRIHQRAARNCRTRKRKRTATGVKFAFASNMCSELRRPRRVVGSCARSASFGRAPRLACRT
jgi:IS5 family transposase